MGIPNLQAPKHGAAVWPYATPKGLQQSCYWLGTIPQLVGMAGRLSVRSVTFSKSRRSFNEAVEKLLKNILTAKWMGGETLPDTTIVDPGAFCEANFLRYVFEIFSFGFFYSLNVELTGSPKLRFGEPSDRRERG